jgi:integrase
VQLQQEALDALTALPTPLTRTQLIFPDRRGGLLNLHEWRKGEWKDALAAAELAHRPPNQMRHTFATLALAANVPIEWVSKRLGHTSIQTTLDFYARFLPAVDDRNLALLDSFAAEALPDGRKMDGIAEGNDGP